MNLKPEQKKTVAEWLALGANIGDVQKRLKEKFGISMTYMDVRFLIDDIGAEIIEKPSVAREKPLQPASEPETDNDFSEGTADFSDEPEQPPQAGSGIQVSVSQIQRPDCIVSGDVVFSNGAKAEWRIDRTGQLGLIPAAGATPPQEDMYDFQRKLQDLLSKM